MAAIFLKVLDSPHGQTRVSVDLLDHGPVEGEVTADEGHALVGWRSPPEVLMDIGDALTSGNMTPQQALEHEVVAEYVERLRIRFGLFEEVQDDALFLAENAHCFEHSADSSSFGGFYVDGSEQPLADAARALRLPSWAELTFVTEGGPGTAWDRPIIVLEGSRTFDDLVEHLRAQHERRGGSF